MKIDKKVISNLTLCYCVSPLTVKGKKCFIVASEKNHPCYLFDEKGNKKETIWEGPGGTMSAVQIPFSDGAFLATHKFYSPNDSKEAKMVMAIPSDTGWRVQTVADMPFLHRFDILERDGRYFILACCLKSGYEGKDDWRFPGLTFGAELPLDIESWPEDRRIEFKLLKDNMLENHGYSKNIVSGIETGIVASNEGCFRFTPPSKGKEEWEIERLTSEPASDALFGDWDGCGEEELITISPFHGDTVSIFKNNGGKLEKVWTAPERMEFAHAICSVTIQDKEYALIGWRKGERKIVLIDGRSGGWRIREIDSDVGSANARYMRVDNHDVIVSANREINEVAYYTIAEDD